MSELVREEEAARSMPAMRSRRWLCLGALLAASGVVLGAFAAHLLRGSLDARALNAFETGVRYQLYHALALLWVGARLEDRPSVALRRVARLMLTGLCLFSGSLYGLSLTGARWLGPVTPIGGLLLIGAWSLLAWTLARSASHAAG